MYLGFDLGTSGAKGVPMDANERIVGSASTVRTVERPHEGFSEQEPISRARGIDGTFAALAASHTRAMGAVRGGERVSDVTTRGRTTRKAGVGPHGRDVRGRAAVLYGSCLALAACSADPTAGRSVAVDDTGTTLPVPVQLRAIDVDTLRLTVDVDGERFSLDAPDRTGRWTLDVVVPPDTTFAVTVTWTTDEGLALAAFGTLFDGAVDGDSFRIDASSYVTEGQGFDADDDGASNVDELRCGSDPDDADELPTPSETCDLPASAVGVLASLQAEGRYGLFLDALAASDREELLSGTGTVLAPTDAAFGVSYADDALEALFDDDDALRLLVDRHVVPDLVLRAADLDDFTEFSDGAVANDGTPVRFTVTSAGEFEYSVDADPGERSRAAAARIDAFDIAGTDDIVVHRAESLVSVDRAFAIDYTDPPPTSFFADRCGEAANERQLPREPGRRTFRIRPGNLRPITTDIELTERARISFRHVEGRPRDSGALLYGTQQGSPILAADDGDGGRFSLMSTVLEPGAYCLAYGNHAIEEAPEEGWEGATVLEVVPTFDAN